MTILSALFLAALGAGDALLVTPDALASVENAYVVDTRSAEDYEKGHLPGAVRVDVEAFSETRDGVQGLLRPLDEVKSLLEQSGLHPDKHIVLYGTGEGVAGIRPATRLFWILEYLGFPRVSLLDGGYEAWTASGGAVQTDPVTPTPVSLPDLQPREELRATADEVALAVTDPSVEVVDVRSSDEFRGEKKSPSVARPGHIPGAENAPASEFIEGGRFKSVDAINEIVAESGVRADGPAITYCNTGRQASVGYFVLRLLGRDNVALYDGSMSEWSADPERDVAAGPAEDEP